MIVGLGIGLAFDPPAVADTIDVGSVPTWADLLFGATVAVIAFTGIEAAANLAPEVRVPRAVLRRTVGAGAAVVLLVFIGMSAVALMALPVEQGMSMSVDSQTTGYGTALGGEWIEAPVLGVVEALTGGFAGELLAWAVAIIATLVLSQAANAGMVGIARTTYTLAVHRQIPRGIARLHPQYGTPWVVLLIFTVLAAILLLPLDIVHRGPLLAAVSPKHAITCLAAILATQVAIMGQLYQVERRSRLIEPDAWLVILIVGAALALIYYLP